MIKDDGDFYLIELSKQEPGQTIYSCVHFLHIVENDDNTVSYFDDGIEIQGKLVFSGTLGECRAEAKKTKNYVLDCTKKAPPNNTIKAFMKQLNYNKKLVKSSNQSNEKENISNQKLNKMRMKLTLIMWTQNFRLWRVHLKTQKAH